MTFIRSLAVLILLLGTAARAADGPNILYIMSDDHAAHAISAYKGRLAEIAPTPNLDTSIESQMRASCFPMRSVRILSALHHGHV